MVLIVLNAQQGSKKEKGGALLSKKRAALLCSLGFRASHESLASGSSDVGPRLLSP